MDAFAVRQFPGRSAAAVRRRFALIGLTALLLLSFVGFNSINEYGSAESDDTFKQIAILAICAMLLAFTHARHGWRQTLALPLSLLLVFGYCLISSTWALAPFISLRRLTLTFLVAWAVFRAVGELGATVTLTCLRNVTFALIAVSFVMVLFTPLGIHHGLSDPPDVIGTWRGIFPHKNVAGEFLGGAIILLAFDPLRTRMPVRIGFLLAALLFLIETRSKTAIAVVVLALAVGYLARAFHPRNLSRVALAGIAAAVIALPVASVYAGNLINAVADPTGFSGRAYIWQLLLAFAQDHLWTGAGYGSYWLIGPTSPILAVSDDWVATTVGHGHNGYLDLLVTIGLPGLALTVLAVFAWPAVLLLLDDAMAASQRGFAAAMLVFCFGDNMTETSLLDRIALLEVMLMLTLALIHHSAAAGDRKARALAALGRAGGSGQRRRLIRLWR